MSSYPSTSTLAPSFGNFAAFSRVDVESLLWEMSHVVRGLTKVTRTQSAELARLGSESVLDQVAEELHERASVALRAVDTTLDQLAADVLAQEDDSWYGVDREGVASWAHATSAELLPADEPATPSDVPADFWNTHAFKWDEEPEPEELERGSAAVPEILTLDTSSQFEDDDLVVPSDSITSRGGDDVEYMYEDEEDEEYDGYSEASFEAGEREHFAHADRPLVYAERIHEDAATLFLAPVDTAALPSTPSTDTDSAAPRPVHRPSWLGAPQSSAKPTASGFDGAAALFGKLLQHSRLAGF